MPQVTGMMNTYNTPQFAGELFTADVTKTPLLSLIGGLSGGKQTNNDEFPTAVLFDYPEPRQPEISEIDSVTAPPGTFTTREQKTNVTQIFQETLEITYVKLSNGGRMSGLNVAGDSPNPQNEKNWQIEQRLKKVARDVEHTFINGRFKRRGAADEANKTRGIIELCTVNVVNGAGGILTKQMLNNLYKQLADNGAYLDNMVMMVNSTRKQELTEIYNSQTGFNLPATRNEGGLNITNIENDFFRFGIVYNPFVPQDTLLLADVAHMAPVFQTVPEKGNFFLEELAKTGAAEKFHLFGQIGLAHGPAFLHGIIQNLKTD